MRIGVFLGALLIGLAICFGLVFVAGFPLMARLGIVPAYGALPGYGMMQGGMPMQPGQMWRGAPVQPQPLPTPAPGQQPRGSVPWNMPGYRQMPQVPFGTMPMMRSQRGLFGGGFGTGGFGANMLGGWRFALSCLGILAGAAAFTALGYALGRRSAGALPAAPLAPAEPGPQAM